MKKLLLSLILVGSINLMNAQDVITFFEDFQTNLAILDDAVPDPADAASDQWINYDQDGLIPANNRPGNWFLTNDLKYLSANEYPGDTNIVASSASWLEGFAPENRNYMILPEIEITDAAHFFSWKSGIRQGPRYMDGYSVGIVTDFEDPEGSFVKIWSAAQMVEETGWVGALYGADYDFAGCTAPSQPIAQQDPTTVCYYPAAGDGYNGTGYVHADMFTNMDYLDFVNPTDDPDPTTYLCLLEPHEIDLSDYIGQSVRICILHDSDDDNLIAIDDLMVSSGLVGVSEVKFERFINMYPNPVQDVLNFNFTGEVKDNAVINVIDTKGAVVYSEVVSGGALRNAVSIDLGAQSAGLYSVSITIDNNKTVTSNIVKR